MRWARGLLASGVAPSEIAIATASPADYDDHFLALRADANIDLHFILKAAADFHRGTAAHFGVQPQQRYFAVVAFYQHAVAAVGFALGR